MTEAATKDESGAATDLAATDLAAAVLAAADRAIAARLEAAGQRLDAERDAAMRAEAEGLGKPYETARQLERPHQFTPLLRHLERLAYQGLTGIQIAARIGVDIGLLAWAAERYSDVRAALAGGAARGADELSAAAMRGAVARGNGSLATFMLKTKHGYAEPKEAPSVVVNVGSEAAPVTLEHSGALADRQTELLRLAGPDRQAELLRLAGPEREAVGPG